MDFDAFLVELSTRRNLILPELVCTNSAGGGFRLGPVDVDPIETLEARCRTRWRGRHQLLLRAKLKANGHVAFAGRLPIDTTAEDAAATPASSPAPGGDSALQAVLENQKALQEQVLTLATRLAGANSGPAPAPTPAPALNEQVGALGALATVFQQVTGGGKGAAAAGDAVSPAVIEQLVSLGKQLGSRGGDAGVAVEALKMLGPSAVKILEVSAAMLITKLTKDDDAETTKANERRKREFEAKKKADAEAAAAAAAPAGTEAKP